MSAELIERLEKAEVGGGVLDLAIAILLNQGFKPERFLPTGRYRENVRLPAEASPYTTSLDAALALAERVLPGSYPGVQKNRWRAHEGPPWSAFLTLAGDFGEIEEDGATAPLALCIAILKAVAAQPAATQVGTQRSGVNP